MSNNSPLVPSSGSELKMDLQAFQILLRRRYALLSYLYILHNLNVFLIENNQTFLLDTLFLVTKRSV